MIGAKKFATRADSLGNGGANEARTRNIQSHNLPFYRLLDWPGFVTSSRFFIRHIAFVGVWYLADVKYSYFSFDAFVFSADKRCNPRSASLSLLENSVIIAWFP